MKLTINKELFQNEISHAFKFTSSQLSSIPSLQGVFIELKDKTLTIKSSNLNDFYSAKVAVDDEGSFLAIFDAKKALEFLNVVPNGDLTISLEKSGLLFSIGTMQGEFGLFQIEDYPTFPSIDQSEKIILTEEMVKAIPQVLFSSSKDDSRPVLTGLLIESKSEMIRFVTTDGFRLSISHYDAPGMEDWLFIASARFIQEMLSFYTGGDLIIQYSKETKVFQCLFGTKTLVSRTIEGDFPPYQKVLPVKYTTVIELDASLFIKNLKAVSIFAREQGNIIIFDIVKNEVTIKPKGQKGISSYAKQETIIHEGEDIKIAFNYRFVLDFLNTHTTKKCRIELTSPVSPVVFKTDQGAEFTHIIMPLRTEEIEE